MNIMLSLIWFDDMYDMLKYFSNYLQVYLSTSIYVFIRNMKISLNIVSRDSMIFDWNVEFVQYIPEILRIYLEYS